MADDEVVLTVRLPKLLYDRLRHAARASDRSMAATLRVLVERGCPDHFDKVGGYPSSPRPASQLRPPPSGPAPGARSTK